VLLLVMSVAALASGVILHRPRSVLVLFSSLVHLLQLQCRKHIHHAASLKEERVLQEPLQQNWLSIQLLNFPFGHISMMLWVGLWSA